MGKSCGIELLTNQPVFPLFPSLVDAAREALKNPLLRAATTGGAVGIVPLSIDTTVARLKKGRAI